MRHSSLFFLLLLPLLLLLFLISACQPAAPVAPTLTPTEVNQAETENGAAADLSRITVTAETIDKRAIPDVDISQHTVPLDEILFDTFRSYDRVVPLTEADDALIVQLRDAIPPLYFPQFVTAAEGDKWLSASDLVLGYEQDGLAIAYPIKILNWHEIAAHEIDGIPIMATY